MENRILINGLEDELYNVRTHSYYAGQLIDAIRGNLKDRKKRTLIIGIEGELKGVIHNLRVIETYLETLRSEMQKGGDKP